MKRFIKYLYNIIPFKPQVFGIIRKMHPSESLFRHLYFKGPFTVKTPDSSFRMIHYGFQIENELFWRGISGAWEKKSMAIWMQFAKEAKTILDIGANTGIYSLLAKCVNPSAKVYAFEPVNRVYEKLMYNSYINSYDIHCTMAALSDNNGEGQIFDTGEEHILSVTVNKNLNEGNRNVRETPVKLLRFDTFASNNNLQQIDLVKIDVETHEPEVLKGMGEILTTCRPVLIVEILNESVGEKVEKIISGMNYLYFNIDDRNNQIRRQSHISRSDHFNYLLCPPEKATSIGLIN